MENNSSRMNSSHKKAMNDFDTYLFEINDEENWEPNNTIWR